MDKTEMSALKELLNSSAGNQLLALMQKDGEAFQKAASAVRAGNYAQAQAILTPLIQNTDAQALAEKLKAKLG